MEAIDLLTTRRSVLVRDLAEPGPTENQLDKILEAGMRVPDHGKIGPWRIQVITKRGQLELGNLFADLFQEEHGARATASMLDFERERPQRAPVLLVITSNLQVQHKIPIMEQRLSGGALCMNILNASHALGFAAQWLTEWPAFKDEVKRNLGHDAGVDIIGFIYIGTPREQPKQRDRPPYDSVVTKWSGASA